MRFALPCVALCLPAVALGEPRSFTAAELVTGVKAARPVGSLYARLRMEHRPAGGAASVLQVQVKRRSLPDGGSESLYQVLFPKDRKGEGLLLRVRNDVFSGATHTPSSGTRPLSTSERSRSVFGTALTLDDLMAGFLDWPAREIVGHDSEGSIPCTVVECRAPGGSGSNVSRVRCWIDEKRLVPMRIEVFDSSNKPVKRVTTHKVVRASSGYFAPVNFTVSDLPAGSSTKVEGVRSETNVRYADADFSEAALRAVTAAAGEGE